MAGARELWSLRHSLYCETPWLFVAPELSELISFNPAALSGFLGLEVFL